jgi:hypothetical protein
MIEDSRPGGGGNLPWDVLIDINCFLNQSEERMMFYVWLHEKLAF